MNTNKVARAWSKQGHLAVDLSEVFGLLKNNKSMLPGCS